MLLADIFAYITMLKHNNFLSQVISYNEDGGVSNEGVSNDGGPDLDGSGDGLPLDVVFDT